MDRYVRQRVLRQIGDEGQEKLKNSKVAVVGLGALGTLTAELLVRAGVGKITLVDKDVVDMVDLHRQVLFEERDIAQKKVVVAREKLQRINRNVQIDVIDDFLRDGNSIMLNDCDLILDCTDNMRARHAINNFCASSDKKWVHAAASGVTGNVLVVDNPEVFAKLFGGAANLDSCEEIGVMNSLTTMISSLQVTEAIKILTGNEYCKDLIRFNAWENKYELIKIYGNI